MNRTTSITLAALLVVATVAVPLAAASVVSRGEAQAEPDADADTEIKPGERFAAAVGVQNAEIEATSRSEHSLPESRTPSRTGRKPPSSPRASTRPTRA